MVVWVRKAERRERERESSEERWMGMEMVMVMEMEMEGLAEWSGITFGDTIAMNQLIISVAQLLSSTSKHLFIS